MEHRLVRPLDKLGDESTTVFILEEQLQAASPPYGDPIIANILGASIVSAENYKAYADLRDRYASTISDDVPAFSVRKWTKAHVGLFGEASLRRELDFPEAFNDEQACLEIFKDLFANPKSPVLKRLERNLERPLQTSRPERRFIYAFIAGLMSRRSMYYGPLMIHDYGGSNGIVMNSLGVGDLDDHETQVVDEAYDDNTCNTNLYRWIVRSAQIEGGYWIESSPPRTNEEKEYVKMCSIEPQQLRSASHDPATRCYEDDYDKASLYKSDRVHLIDDDFTRLTTTNEEKLQVNRADLTHFSHSLSENPEAADRAIVSAISRTKSDGLIAVTGRFDVDPHNPQRLIPLQMGWYRKPWLCKTLVLDIKNQDQGWFTLLEGEDGSGLRLRVKNEERIVKEKLFE